MAVACVLALAVVGAMRSRGQELDMRKHEKPVFGETVRGCRLSIAAPEFLVAGEPVTVTMILKNDSGVAIVMPIAYEIDFRFRVLRRDGSEAPLTLYGVERRRIPVYSSQMLARIEPGKEFEKTVVLNRLVDMTVSTAYTVQASRTIGDAQTGEAFDVTSNAIVLELREP